MIRTLIVDDSPLVRDGIRMLLGAEKDIQIVGEAGDGDEAVAAISQLAPDLTFLDVQMPSLDGFQVIEKCASVPVGALIFVTAYDDYALRAFQANALGYLLKPIAPRMFEAVLNRARQVLASSPAPPAARAVDRRPLSRLVVKDQGRFMLLRPAEVDWITAAGDYVQLHTNGRTFLVRSTLSELEESLQSNDFVRIHRSTIVNLDRVQEITALAQGDYAVRLKNGTRLRMSRAYRDRLLP